MEDKLSVEDQEFLKQCEEELKNRYTERDEEYLKVFNKVPSTPPIMENYWQPSSNYGRRNEHRNHRNNYQPHERHGNRDRQGSHRGYNDNNIGYYRSRY